MIRWICQGFESFRINKTLKQIDSYQNSDSSFESFRINKTLKHVIDLVIPFPVLNPSVLTRLSNPVFLIQSFCSVLNPSVLTRLSNGLWIIKKAFEVLNPSVLTRLSNMYWPGLLLYIVLNPSVLTRLSNLKSGSHRALPSNDRWLLI